MWNEWPTATRRENAGVYRLLCVNVNGINRLRRIGLFSVRGVATRRLLRVNVLKTQPLSIRGRIPCAPSSVKALSFAPTAGAALRGPDRRLRCGCCWS